MPHPFYAIRAESAVVARCPIDEPFMRNLTSQPRSRIPAAGDQMAVRYVTAR